MDHTRHIGLFNADGWTATVIGAGGIGAITALVLAKMGIGLTIVDDDKVSTVNIATQFYPISSVDVPKAWALADLLSEMSDFSGVADIERITEENADLYRSPIIISAVDSIKARQAIWAGIKHSHWLWYIDARMGAETFLRYAVCGDKGERAWYDRLIIAQDEDAVPELPCTSKATIYCGALAAGLLGSDVKKIVIGEAPEKFLSYNLPNNTLLIP